MRRHFNPAMEAQSFSANISLEEEQVMLDEAASDAVSVNDDLNEAERIIEVSEGLEDLAVIADGIEEATPAETALIETAGDMAVAGTDVDPEEVIPAMESYRGRRISTEGIRETAQTIWRSIQEFLKNIWKKIEAFFYKHFGTIPALRKRLKELQSRVEAKSGSSIEEKKVTLNSGLTSLSVEYKVVKTGAELKTALGEMEKATNWAFGEVQTNLSKAGDKIADAISDFDPEKAEESAQKMVTAVKEAKASNPPGSSKVSGNRWPSFEAYQGPALLGNVSLVSKHYSEGRDGNGGVLAKLDRMRRGGVGLEPTNEKSKDAPSSSDFTTMSTSDMEDAIKTCEKILDHLEDFNRGKRATDIKTAKGKIETASKKATGAVEKAANDEDAKACVPYYRAVLNFNASYARWAQSPAMGLSQVALTSVRATMAVITKCLGAYKA